jgi:acyl carrier protein
MEYGDLYQSRSYLKMDTISTKLAHCFSLVFPNLEAVRIPDASAENVTEWDSVAQVNLLTLIGEEFAIDIDFEDFEGATSFKALAARLEEMSPSA